MVDHGLSLNITRFLPGGFGGMRTFLTFFGVLCIVAIGLILYTAAGEVRPETVPLPSYDAVLSSSPPADLSDDLDDPEAAEMPHE